MITISPWNQKYNILKGSTNVTWVAYTEFYITTNKGRLASFFRFNIFTAAQRGVSPLLPSAFALIFFKDI